MDAQTLNQFKRRTTLRQIEILVMVQRMGSITEAAKALDMSAANVSRTCQRFEQNASSPVFQKTRKGVAFTNWGIFMLKELKSLEKAIITFTINLDVAIPEISDGTSKSNLDVT